MASLHQRLVQLVLLLLLSLLLQGLWVSTTGTLSVAAASASTFPASVSHVFHIIAHSHCDPGWLNTFEGYYGAEVRTILDAIVRELAKDSRRKFTWSETSYF